MECSAPDGTKQDKKIFNCNDFGNSIDWQSAVILVDDAGCNILTKGDAVWIIFSKIVGIASTACF